MFNNLKETATLTNRGYRIDYELLNFEQKQKIKDDLTIKIIDAYSNYEDKYFLFHKVNNQYVYIPRYYGEEKIGKPKNNLKKPINIDIKFNGELKDFQKEIINNIIPKIKNKGGGIISLPCGFGKTVIGIYICCMLKLKTIILVNREELLNQWIERINQFSEECKIGVIKQNIIDIENKDIVIGMLQSISMKDYDREIFKDFGLLIVDECHHISSKIFSKALYKITTKYTIGLSATPNRNDHLEYVYKWYLGDILYKLEQKQNKNVNVCIFNFYNEDKYFKETKKYNVKQKRDTFNYPLSVSNLTKIKDRNILILNIIKELIKNPLRKILILSDRVEHLEKLNISMNNYITKNKLTIKSCVFIGKNKKEEKKDAIENGDIIFGSYSIAKEGLDIPRMNTIILSTPQNDIVQSIGRIMRKFNPNCMPLIIDITDYLPSWNKFLSNRLKTYTKNHYNISSFSYFNSKLFINYNFYNVCNNSLFSGNFSKNINKNMKILLDYSISNLNKNNDINNDIDKNNDKDKNNDIDKNKDKDKNNDKDENKDKEKEEDDIDRIVREAIKYQNQKLRDEYNNIILTTFNNIFSKY